MVQIDRVTPSFAKQDRKQPKAYEGSGQCSQIPRNRWKLGSKITSIQRIEFNTILPNKRHFYSMIYAKEKEGVKERRKIKRGMN